MKRIERLREYFYQRRLREIATQTKKRITRLAQARTVGICFPGDNVKVRQQVLAYAEKLRKAGKKVRLLAYLSIVDKEASFDFDFYAKRQISWARVPKGPGIDQFLGQSYDAFICLFPQTNPQVEFLSGAVSAGLQIGPRPVRNIAKFDIMIDAKPGLSIPAFIQCYEAIFAKVARPALAAV